VGYIENPWFVEVDDITKPNMNKNVGSYQRQYDVVVVGEINVDLILQGNVVPSFSQVEQIVDDANLVIGSSSVIFACGAARLGLRTAVVGKVGNDLFGKFMIDSMEARGVDTRGVIVDPQIPTGLSVILAKQNDRAILTHLGSIPALTYDEIDIELISESRHLHLGSFFMLDGLRPDIPKLFRKAKEMGLSISLDTNYDPAGIWDDGLMDAMQYVDVMLPNDTEALAISAADDYEVAIEMLVRTGPLVAVKLGESGAIVKRGSGQIIKQEACPFDVVDTVGAGDSFDAGFVYGYLNQWGLKKTLQFAVACGSLSTRKAGGTDAQAELGEALQVMGKMN